VPELLKLGALFAIVILLLRLKLPLSLALLAAALAAGALFQIPVSQMLSAFRKGLLGWTTWHLLGSILTITTLGGLLRRGGKLAEMALGAEQVLKSRRAALGVVPALIGMMPMPGGALLSAPMVEELDSQKELSAEQKASINYLFRHVMEFFFPLYPGMLLLAALLKTPVFNVVYALFPLFVVLLLGCARYLARAIKLSNGALKAQGARQGWKQLGSGLWPVVLIVTLSLGFHLDILYALLAALVLSALFIRAGLKELFLSLKEGIGLETVFSILTIMVFQNVLSSSPVIRELPAFFTAAGLPGWIPVFFVPMVAGLLTGMTTACIGLTFPALTGFLIPPGQPADFGLAALAYTGGFLGIMASPAHLCLVLTYDFFKPKRPAVYRQMLLPLMLLGLAALLLYWGGFPWGLIRQG
jgi:hypothetical protein